MFSLKQQITRFLMAIVIILTLLMITLLSVMVRTYQNNQNDRRMDDLAAYAEALDNSIIQLNDTVGSIYSSNSAFEGLNMIQSPADKYNDVYDLLNLLQIQVKSNQNLNGLFVFYDNAEKVIYFVKENMAFADKEALKNNGRLFVDSITYNYEGSVVAAEKESYYNVFLKKSLAAIMGSTRLSLGLPDEPDDTAAYGVIYGDTFYRTAGEKTEVPYESCASLEPGRNIVGDTVVYLQKLSSTEMSVVEILPKSLGLYFGSVHIVLALLMLFLIVLLIRLYRFVYKQLSEPLEDMTYALQQIQAGVWKVNFHAPNRITEIENVRETVQVMLKELEQYKIRNYEEKLEKQKTELQYLQLQLAPHFYTNCLKNAYYMLMLKEYDNVEQFLLCLSTHLRYLLQKDVSLVAVRTEKDFVLNYINLQKLMTSKPISCEIEADEETLNMEIPILALQTFVENSVKYARDSEEKDLLIQIRVQYMKTENEDYLDIIVKDNGNGYQEEVLQMLNQREPSERQHLGVGVINLLNRIRIQYGEEARWYFTNNTAGAFSELILPADRRGEK